MRRPCPTAGPPRPDRSSSAGDSSAPAATTTRGQRTITRVPSAQVASTPAARPSPLSTRSARQRTTNCDPCSYASTRYVLSVPCLLPVASPNPRYPAEAGSYVAGSVLRTARLNDHPSASQPSASRWFGSLRSLHRSLAEIRARTASTCASKSGPSTPSRPAAAQSERTRWLGRTQFVQLTVVPPPRHDPASRATPSTLVARPPR